MPLNKSQHIILFDCERMKHPHTGLYHFCLQLGKHLLQTSGSEYRFCFYTPPAVKGIFGTNECYLEQASLQKFWLPATKGFSIWHNTYQSSMYFPKGRNVKIILTIHDLNILYDEKKTSAKKAAFLRKLKSKIERADHVVAISKFTLNDVMTHIDMGSKPCSVIYNGCNINPLQTVETPGKIPSGAFLFTIGTIIEKKNFHVLPCLLAGNDYKLVIAGITQSETYKARIIAEAENWGVSDRLIFTGAVSENDKQWYLQHCKAFVFPSIAEGFGLPVVEAMHFGKPVLLSMTTSLPEIGGDAAYYFPSFAPEAMQQTLTESLKDFDTADRSEQVRQRSQRFSWEASAQQYAAVYQSLLQ